MPLTDDEKSLLEKLTAKAKEPEHGADHEIEIYDTKSGKGARLPFSAGASWLYSTFGIGEAPPAKEGETKPAGDGKETGGSGGSVSYFGGTRKTG